MFKIKNAFFSHSRCLTTLEIAVTDLCDLRCRLCAQGTAQLKNKKSISLNRLIQVSEYFRPHVIGTVKISGGEPTLHPEFAQICRQLKSLFHAKKYTLATNGCLLERYVDPIRVFDTVDLSLYPGQNDEVYHRLTKLGIPNLIARVKRDRAEMMDIFCMPNQGKKNVFQNCGLSSPANIYKIVQDRIYPCCNVFGLSQIREGIDIDKISVVLDENWRGRLLKLDIEEYCKLCFFDVEHQKNKLYHCLRDLKNGLTGLKR